MHYCFGRYSKAMAALASQPVMAKAILDLVAKYPDMVDGAKDPFARGTPIVRILCTTHLIL